MEIRHMRLADRWLGAPVCALLTLVRKLLKRLRLASGQPIRRVLFVKLAEQGSTVLAAPAIGRAVEMVGRENVFFLVFEENRFILDAMELVPVENVVAIPVTDLRGAVRGAVQAVRRLRAARIDAAIDLEFFARSSAALCWLSGAVWRVGFHAYGGEASYRGNLMTHRLSFNPYLHTSQTFQAMVEALAFPPEKFPAFALPPPALLDSFPVFRPRPQEIEEVKTLLRETRRQTETGSLILLNANCSDLLPLRRWPVEHYVALARRLLQRCPEVGLVFTGAPREQAETERLATEVRSDRCHSLAGRTTLRQLLVLYGLAEVLVTNDSGPAHFATLTPIDVVTLFGPETPALFAAPSPRSHVLWAGIACSPCINAYNDRQSTCRDNVCMRRITVEQVFEKVCDVYDRRTAKADAALGPSKSGSPGVRA